MFRCLAGVAAAFVVSPYAAPRARDLGVPFEGAPGRFNAITDVPGVEVGHRTIVQGRGKLVVGEGPVRTGVSAIFPRGSRNSAPVYAGWFSMNGNGEMTGTAWIEESGELLGPVVLTNTHSVGIARDAVIQWQVRRGNRENGWWSLPVVAETWDGWLSDINGFHVHADDVFAALEAAEGGPVAEGNVGSGTGMICYEFKGGIGTSSRVDDYTVGVLVQANHGLRGQLMIAGVPVGREIREGAFRSRETGSLIAVIATDAPLIPHQLKRLARRAALGMARTGAISGNSSGDLFIAFSTGNPVPADDRHPASIETLSSDAMSPLFEQVIQATEEAIINALVAAETMIGRDDHRVEGLPHDRLREILVRYGRLPGGLALEAAGRTEAP